MGRIVSDNEYKRILKKGEDRAAQRTSDQITKGDVSKVNRYRKEKGLKPVKFSNRKGWQTKAPSPDIRTPTSTVKKKEVPARVNATRERKREPTAGELIKELRQKNIPLSKAKEFVLSRSPRARRTEQRLREEEFTVSRPFTTTRPDTLALPVGRERAIKEKTAEILPSPVAFEVEERRISRPGRIPERAALTNKKVPKEEQIIFTGVRGTGRKGIDQEDIGVRAAEQPGIFDLPGRLRKQAQKLEARSQRAEPGTFERPLAGVAAIGTGFAAGVAQPFFHPIETAKGFVTALTSPIETAGQVGKGLKEQPGTTLGELGGIGKGTQLFARGAFATARFAKETTIKATRPFEAPEKVIDVKTLEGTQRLPETRSLQESLTEFRKPKTPEGEIQVVSAAPQKIKGLEAGPSRKGAEGLEDPGIFVTPKGRASAEFTGIKDPAKKKPGEVFAEELSTTPDPLSPVKELFQTPTITEFKAKGVSRLPKETREAPGFGSVSEFFQKEGSKTGEVFITKRSEIGLGTIKRQTFIPEPIDLAAPGASKGRKIKVKEGKPIKESGTSELEAVIPLGTKFRYLPGTRATTFRGRTVLIRRAELISEGKVKKSRTEKIQEVTPEFAKSQSSFYRSGRGRPSYRLSRVALSAGTKFSSLTKASSRPGQSLPKSGFAPSSITRPSKTKSVSGPVPGRGLSSPSSLVSKSSSLISRGPSTPLGGLSAPTKRPPLIVPRLKRDETTVTKKKKRKSDISQPKGLSPSAFAVAFQITGKGSKLGIKTGLGVRPITKKLSKTRGIL